MARSAASTMLGGVGKSGSPISRWMMLRPLDSSARARASTSKAVSVPISPIRAASFSGIRSAPHAEWFQVAAIVRPLDFDVLDSGHARTLAEQADQTLEVGASAFGFDLHRAIVAIPDEAMQSKLATVALGEHSGPDALDVAHHLGVKPAAFCFTGHRRRRRRRRWSARGGWPAACGAPREGRRKRVDAPTARWEPR